MYVLLALLSSVLFGVWAFGIGRYRGSISVFSVVLVSATAAAMVYLVVGLANDGLEFAEGDVLRGLAGGALNVSGTLLVLKAFQRGPMGVVSGVAASSTLVPLAYSLLTGESLSPLVVAGIGLIFAGLLVFYVPSMKRDPNAARGLGAVGLALIAALFYGLATVTLDRGSLVSITATMLVSQIPQVLVAFVMVAFVARSWGGLTRRALLPLAGAGVALGLGQVAFFAAAGEGSLGVVSVLGSLSPLVTALLALVFLSEKMTRWQTLALVIVLMGTCLVVA
ncbi:MAG: DMT family transporter [Actinobacteria bacterium]|nr:DMT family transporter [Actinomycetota bacterium]